MTAGDIVDILYALAALVAAIGAAYAAFQAKAARTEVGAVKIAAEETHTLVNSQRTEMLTTIDHQSETIREQAHALDLNATERHGQ